MPLVMDTAYLRRVFNDREELIWNAREILKEVDFDTMIGTGLSGSLVIPVLAEGLGKYWAIARKDNDGSHSYHKVEGLIGDRWIFVDDLIATGKTRKRVYAR